METMMAFAVLAIVTILALFAAVAVQALLLRIAFFLMQPATANRRTPRPAIERGSQLAARAFAHSR
jgi:hypothetical protein